MAKKVPAYVKLQYLQRRGEPFAAHRAGAGSARRTQGSSASSSMRRPRRWRRVGDPGDHHRVQRQPASPSAEDAAGRSADSQGDWHEKGSGTPNTTKVAKISRKQLEEMPSSGLPTDAADLEGLSARCGSAGAAGRRRGRS